MVRATLRYRLAIIVSAAASPVAAQSVAHVTVDLTYGTGGHSESAGATWYRALHNVHPRAAIAVLSSPWRHVSAVGSLEYVGQWGASDFTSDCEPSPNGTCRKYFPRLQGRGLTIGARATGGPITFSVGAGRVGGFRWSAVDSDVELRLARHVGFVMAARGAWRRGPDGKQIDFWPINTGFRLKI